MLMHVIALNSVNCRSGTGFVKSDFRCMFLIYFDPLSLEKKTQMHHHFKVWQNFPPILLSTSIEKRLGKILCVNIYLLRCRKYLYTIIHEEKNRSTILRDMIDCNYLIKDTQEIMQNQKLQLEDADVRIWGNKRSTNVQKVKNMKIWNLPAL